LFLYKNIKKGRKYMKKLLKTLTAILAAIVTLVSVACSPNTPPANADAEIENSEQLAYSLNRLENADVSFSFKESKTSSQNLLYSVGNATVSNGLATSSYSTQTYSTSNPDLIIDATKDDMHVEEGSIGWMESRTESISETAERAQDVIDTLLDTITVMDKLVIDDEFCQGSMLSYNEQTDIVTAYVISYVDSTFVPTTTVRPDGGMIGSTQGDNPFLMAADGTIKNAYKIMVYDDAEGNEVAIDCDTIIMAVGSKKNEFDVEGVTVPVYYAGDCAGERTADIASAIRGGYNAANEI
jgi:hypothetical protein